MKYADVDYNGDKYRAVKFDSYRPYFTDFESTPVGDTYLDNNGYEYGKITGSDLNRLNGVLLMKSRDMQSANPLLIHISIFFKKVLTLTLRHSVCSVL